LPRQENRSSKISENFNKFLHDKENSSISKVGAANGHIHIEDNIAQLAKNSYLKTDAFKGTS
jgi:hypothetical protein